MELHHKWAPARKTSQVQGWASCTRLGQGHAAAESPSPPRCQVARTSVRPALPRTGRAETQVACNVCHAKPPDPDVCTCCTGWCRQTPDNVELPCCISSACVMLPSSLWPVRCPGIVSEAKGMHACKNNVVNAADTSRLGTAMEVCFQPYSNKAHHAKASSVMPASTLMGADAGRCRCCCG